MLRAGSGPGLDASPDDGDGSIEIRTSRENCSNVSWAAQPARRAGLQRRASQTRWWRGIVAPHIVRGPDPSVAVYVSAVDAAATALMRRVLHDPGVQALEARWRGVRRLVETLELGDSLELRIFDVGKDALIADLNAAEGRLEATGLYRAIAKRGSDAGGEVDTTLLVGDYTFGATGDDLELLAHLGNLAQRLGAPLVAGGDASLLGTTDSMNMPNPGSGS